MKIVRNIFNAFYRNYLSIAGSFTFSSLLIAGFFAAYRIEVYDLIKTIYTNLDKFFFSDYISISIHFDLSILMALFSMTFVIMMILCRSPKALYGFLSLILIILFFIISSSIEFFKVYETTFHFKYIEGEISTGWYELLTYAGAGASSEFYIKMALIIPLLLPFSLRFIYKTFAEAIKRMPYIRSLSPYLTIFYTPLVFLLLISFHSLSEPTAFLIEKLAKKHPHISEKKIVSLLNEFSYNPFSSVIEDTSKRAPSAITDAHEKGKDKFSFKFDTGSLVSKKRYSRLNYIPRGKRYNIILYFFESTTFDYLRIKINEKYVTPTWRKMAQNSFIAMNHYANFPLSANTMFSVFTSSYELHTDNLVIRKYPEINLKTLPEILKEKGYRTCLIHSGGLGYVGQRRFLKNRKFDRIIEFDDLKNIPPFNKKVGYGVDERAMIQPSIDFVKKDRSKPFFLAYFPVSPHHPYAIPDKSFAITGRIPPGTGAKKKIWLQYLNSLYYSDFALGMLVEELEKEGLLDNTLFFLFADHGEAFYQHKRNFTHRKFIYEENVHVPFLIYNKKFFKEPVRFYGITRHIDILPTILDLLSIKGSLEQEGVPIFSSHPEQLALLHTTWKDQYWGIRDEKWKYIIRTGDGYEELYNLQNDPHEKINIAADNSSLLKVFRKYIKKAKLYRSQYFKIILNRNRNPRPD